MTKKGLKNVSMPQRALYSSAIVRALHSMLFVRKDISGILPLYSTSAVTQRRTPPSQE